MLMARLTDRCGGLLLIDPQCVAAIQEYRTGNKDVSLVYVRGATHPIDVLGTPAEVRALLWPKEPTDE
jgi:hypothetical protein